MGYVKARHKCQYKILFQLDAGQGIFKKAINAAGFEAQPPISADCNAGKCDLWLKQLIVLKHKDDNPELTGY